MVHGVQHNCGAFDRLIPLFKNNYNLVAIDLPSHGLSSHFPEGSPLNLIQFVLALKRVSNYLKWTKFSLVGHSFGGQISTYYAAIYPQDIQSLVVIDSMEPRPVPLNDTLTYLQTVLNQQLDLEEKLVKKSPPIYSYDEAYEKVKKNDKWNLTDEAAKDLMKRAVKSHQNGYTFTCDQRLKFPMRPLLTFEQQKEIMKNISCPVLFILTDGNMARYSTYLKQMYEYNCSKINNTIIIVKGDHAIHQNFPEKISHLIDEFLISKRLNSKVEHVTYNGNF